MGQKWTIFHSLILLPFRVTSTHSVTFYTFWGSSWGVPSTWRAPQRHKGPRASPQTRLRWLTRQKLAKSPPLCPCEWETQTLNHWLLPQPWLCCCCSVSLSPPKLPLCVFFPMPGLWVAPGGSGQPQVALGGCVWHCSPCHPQPALSWSSLYSLATLPLLHAGSLHKIYGSCSKIFSFFITSRSSLFLSNLGKPRPCSLKKKKTLKKKTFFTFLPPYWCISSPWFREDEGKEVLGYGLQKWPEVFYLISVPLAMWFCGTTPAPLESGMVLWLAWISC